MVVKGKMTMTMMIMMMVVKGRIAMTRTMMTMSRNCNSWPDLARGKNQMCVW